jgi:hypothetical protein
VLPSLKNTLAADVRQNLGKTSLKRDVCSDQLAAAVENVPLRRAGCGLGVRRSSY